MNSMPMHNILFAVLLFGATSLAGCTGDPEGPPILHIDEVRYWYEKDIIVINVTFTNDADFVPDTPVLGVGVDEWFAESGEVRFDHNNFHNQARYLSTSQHFYSNDEYPAENRLYSTSDIQELGLEQSGKSSPVNVMPGQSLSYEFGFLLANGFFGREGYYTIDVTTRASYHDINEDRGLDGGHHEFWSGCFNHNTPEFYGDPPGNQYCPYFDETGRDTESGIAIFGQEHAGTPRLVYDSSRDR